MSDPPASTPPDDPGPIKGGSISLTPWRRFLIGAFGAASPEAWKWFQIMSGSAERTVPDFVGYIVATLVFAAFSGGFATLMRDDSMLKNFYFGASFPSVVSKIVAAATQNAPVGLAVIF